MLSIGKRRGYGRAAQEPCRLEKLSHQKVEGAKDMVRYACVLQFLLWVGLTGSASAQSVMVQDAWIRPTLGVATGTAAYFTINNGGGQADRLIAVSVTGAAMAHLHQTTAVAGGSAMRPVAALDIGPRSRVELKPGGLHVMVMGLARPLKEGEQVKLSLTFQRAGRVDLSAKVTNRAPAPPHH